MKDFSVACHENENYILELKESLFILRDAINESKYTFWLTSINLNDLLAYCLLNFVNLRGKFLVILPGFKI